MSGFRQGLTPQEKQHLNATYVARGPVPSGDTTGAQDYANLTAAISALPAGGGVLILNGTYYVNAAVALPDGVGLFSFSAATPYLTATPSIAVALIVGTAAAGDVITDSTGSSCGGLYGIGIDGQNNMRPVHLTNGQRWGVKSVSLVNAPGSALQVDAGVACAFENILVLNACQSPVTAITGAVDIDGTDHYLTNIEASCSQSALSSSSQYQCGIALRGSNCMVSRCVGEMSDIGWQVTGSYNKISDCRGDSNFAGDWAISGSANVFANSKGYNGGRAAANTYDCWTITGGQNRFTTCTFEQAGGGTYRYGFNDGSANASPQARSVFDRSCGGQPSAYGTGLYSTNYAYDSGSLDVAPLPVHPAAGVVDPDVTATSLLVLDLYTAATTITSFPNGVPGQDLYVMAPNAFVTIANGGSIYTNTGANKALTANVMYHFKNYNGAWYEVAA